MNDSPTDRTVSDALQVASHAAGLLADAGTRVIGAYANGRRPVLIIDKPPTFVRGAVKTRGKPHPDGGRRTLVLGASFQGCQLEWWEDVPVAQEVRHG
ncbi:hypothetical protein [Luteimonas terricola]|uniref:Uncharacterized protein n=1 Tax=Luteimonas terricola TaxID=645597 RepID=A0ABQ2EE65_9GAMM|nr:hypothetical protein [Luteimonas terricola]GGK08779.1 hypothetical protein GCM10011394_17780 [Luteimonas terricola]